MNLSMPIGRSRWRKPSLQRARWPIAGLIVAWALVLLVGLLTGLDKLVAIGIMAAVAMLAGWQMAERRVAGPAGLSVTDGLAAGTMIASACIFLLPSALSGDPYNGGLGVTAGLLLGIALDRLMRSHDARRADGDSVMLGITLHAAAAGAAMGLAYAAVPSLSVTLGIVIVAHKLPAGYALARARQTFERSRWPILAPSFAVALVAIPVALGVDLDSGMPQALLMGLATGVFLHVGLDFARLPAGAKSTHDKIFVMAALMAAVVVVIVGFGLG